MNCVFLHFLFLSLLLVTEAQTTGKDWGNKTTRGRSHRGYYGDRAFEQLQAAESGKEKKPANLSTKSNAKSNSYTLSAWGIVGVVLTVILAGIGLYYVILFYPILCKKERKYDVIELDAV